jgi:hypothetical protein
MNILEVLPKLSVLNMQSNEISEIIPGTFKMFSRLEYLYLDYNRIEHMRSDVFTVFCNLKRVGLEGNKLRYLNPDTFFGLENLQSLSLSVNPGLQIPTDSPLIKSHSLKQLEIAACNISSVSVETFANVSALEWLDLGFNYLRTLNISILRSLPSLSTLVLFPNPLQCDCQLQEVWRWCQDHFILTGYNEIVPICGTPSEVNGIWWGVLEKGQCLEDNIQYYGDYKNTRYKYTLTEYMDKYTNAKTEIENNRWTRFPEIVKLYELPVSAVLFIIGTTGNVILIIIIMCNKEMRTVPNMYILNLAISDSIYLTVLFLDALKGRISITWLSGKIGCEFFTFCNRMSIGLTAYSVALLSIER